MPGTDRIAAADSCDEGYQPCPSVVLIYCLAHQFVLIVLFSRPTTNTFGHSTTGSLSSVRPIDRARMNGRSSIDCAVWSVIQAPDVFVGFDLIVLYGIGLLCRVGPALRLKFSLTLPTTPLTMPPSASAKLSLSVLLVHRYVTFRKAYLSPAPFVHLLQCG